MNVAVRPSALIYVQHLLGVGHLARISRIAAALVARGVHVIMVRGGTPVTGFDVPGSEMIQLDPVHADPGALNQLVGDDGLPFDKSRQATRRDFLLGIVAARRPDIVVIEAFPFGRRAMRFELLPLLDQARSHGVKIIASSVRDILQENTKPGRAEETAELIERCFDLVLVHGDEKTTPLHASFPLAARIAANTIYTGIVGPEPIAEAVQEHAVIVSAGGGAVGTKLLLSAVEARPLTSFADKPWLVVTGPNMNPMARAFLLGHARPGLDVRTFVPDLPARLAGARLSISQAGYNTVAELLAARCRSVLIPFEQGGETEQLTRAQHIASRGLAICLREADLSPQTLAMAIERAEGGIEASIPVVLDGAQRTADVLLSHLDKAGRRSSKKTAASLSILAKH